MTWGTLIITALGLLGCSNRVDANHTRTLTERIEPPAAAKFFCEWDHQDEAFQKAVVDYAQGNRRVKDAWLVVRSRDQPGGTAREQGMCWQGALLYIGIFGGRAELPKLTQLLSNDPVLASEVNTDLPGGATEFGLDRLAALRYAGYQAIAAQVRRQALYDGSLNSDAMSAQALMRACASSPTKCMRDLALNDWARFFLQRGAVRGLAISGAEADLQLLRDLRQNIDPQRPELRPAIEDALFISDWLNENLPGRLSSIPAP